ncbi:UNVERIFIED_CONTAM: hypothetical protein Slati_2946500 [Sesamum latifolium]|uniref:MULE transposase domain-containing protein n=1 Tax=Sesamum latifolium TaxID=2727402 RepID=A0AAW2VER6_9LAMI
MRRFCFKNDDKLRSHERDLSPVGPVISDILNASSVFFSCLFTFVKRLGNSVAHTLAKSASECLVEVSVLPRTALNIVTHKKDSLKEKKKEILPMVDGVRMCHFENIFWKFNNQGNVIEKEIEEGIRFSEDEIMNEGDGVTQQGDEGEGVTQQGEGFEGVTQQGECETEHGVVRVEDIGRGWGFDAFGEDEEIGLEHLSFVMNKGKRKISELNYNDSSDSDYQQPDNIDESSEEFDMLGDNEVISQEDVPMARKMKKNVPSNVVANENWYSEVDGESDLESLDDEIPYHSFYNDETKITDMNLVVGMKFASAQGQLLVAVGRDGNDNMIPIALVVVQVENRDNWPWFISELLEDIGGLGTDRWSFISDRQKGLVEALRELAPESEHRAYMKKIAEIDPKKTADQETAAEWLNARDKPIITMLERIRTKLMTRLQYKRLAIADMRHHIEDYVDSCYKKPAYLKVYENMIHGIPGQEEYIQTGSEPLNAPKFKKKESNVAKTVGGSHQSHVVEPTAGDPSKNHTTTEGGREYQSPRNDTLLGIPLHTTTGGVARQRKPTIEQVLQNIKAKKRAWRP